MDEQVRRRQVELPPDQGGVRTGISDPGGLPAHPFPGEPERLAA
jgi:hypothetical protein